MNTRTKLTVALAAVVSLLPLAVVADDDSARSVLETTRSAMEKWVETRRLISQERRDWALGREMLEDRIDLAYREIETLRAKIGEAQKNIAEADRKRANLVTENERLKTATAALADTVRELEGRTRALVARMPAPMQDRVETLSRRIPDDPENTRLSLSDRFLNVVGILNETNKFNREIVVTSEVRELADGTRVEVAVVYLGLGKAFYVNTKGTVAGIGTSSPEGWTWTPANGAAPRIAAVVAILKNEQEADFVQLPIRID